MLLIANAILLLLLLPNDLGDWNCFFVRHALLPVVGGLFKGIRKSEELRLGVSRAGESEPEWPGSG